MDYKATSKYVRVSTRKVRLVADAIRPLSPDVALVQLHEMPKVAAKPLYKAIASAVENAKTKGVKVEDLKFKRIEIMGGPVMKRWNPVSKGQAHAYKKRMTHITIVLTDEGKETSNKK
jgi:large subunit ribosomal protein L22